MQKIKTPAPSLRKKPDDALTRYLLPVLLFVPVAVILYWLLQGDKNLTFDIQKWLYPLCVSVMLGALVALWVSMQFRDRNFAKPKHGRLFYPVISGLLAMIIMSLAYVYLVVWPIGDKSVMLVDMHHQYAPLLSKLRDMFLHGSSPLYSFEVGLGTNFLPLFGYYLASPLNLLLVLFPDRLLSEGIFFITLIKIGLSSAFFAACVQYVYRRRDFCVPVVAIMYGLMMYMLAYSWNIMWLDCVMILPLVILFFEHMMRTGRFLGYTLTLAYALFSNYYIGFMLCVFLVLYYLVYVLRRPRTLDRQLHGFSHFAVGSLLAGGLAMFLLIPVYIGLGHTSAAGGSLPEEWKNNFDLFDLLGRHLYNTSPTIRSGKLPNIYCGMLSVLLLPIFATMKTISRRRRVTYLALAAVIGMSMVLNVPNLLWHGLHAPNDLPYRFSFLYSFVLLLIAFETLTHIRDIRLSQLGGAFIGIASYLVLEDRFGDEA